MRDDTLSVEGGDCGDRRKDFSAGGVELVPMRRPDVSTGCQPDQVTAHTGSPHGTVVKGRVHEELGAGNDSHPTRVPAASSDQAAKGDAGGEPAQRLGC